MDLQYESVPEGVPVISDEIKKQLEDSKNIESVSLYRQRTYVDSLYYMNTALNGGSVLGIDEDYFNTAGYRINPVRDSVKENLREIIKQP